MQNNNKEARQLLAKELTKVKRIHYQTITAGAGGQIFQADLTQMDPYHRNLSADGKKQPRYILTCIDIYSRYAQAEFCTSKRPPGVLDAFKRIIKRFKKLPVVLQTDDGTEFKGKFGEWMEKVPTEHHVFNKSSKHKSFHNEMSIVERFHRTMKMLTQKDFIINDNFDYLNHLQENIREYNNTVHSGIKAKPIDVWTGKAIPDMKNVKRHPLNLRPGTKVRIKRNRGTFGKKTLDIKWSNEIYTTESNNGLSYKLVEIDDERFTTNEVAETAFIDDNTHFKKQDKNRELQKKKRRVRAGKEILRTDLKRQASTRPRRASRRLARKRVMRELKQGAQASPAPPKVRKVKVIRDLKEVDDKVWLFKRVKKYNKRKRKYLVEWEGVNPDTGEPWADTWEPPENIPEEYRKVG